MRRIFLFTITLMAMSRVWAYDFAVGGIYYNVLDFEKKELEVAPLNSDPVSNINAYVGKVVIPESVSLGNYVFKITSIGSNAFSHCLGLTEVSLPATISSLGLKSFEGCTNLTTISFPSSLNVIGSEAFKNCSGLCSLHFVENSVSEIQSGAFADCRSLSKVTLPYGVSHICGEAFKGCTSLREIEISRGTCKTLCL